MTGYLKQETNIYRRQQRAQVMVVIVSSSEAADTKGQEPSWMLLKPLVDEARIGEARAGLKANAGLCIHEELVTVGLLQHGEV